MRLLVPVRSLSCFLAISAVSLVVFASSVSAQEKPAFDPALAKDSNLPLPSPYDKLLAIQEALGDSEINWSTVYNEVSVDVDANRIDARPELALALGVKIADGIVSVKAQNVEALNRCADQIEAIAKKLGAQEGDLSRARAIRENANREKWLNVFLELGFLQADIMKILNEEGRESERTLIVAAGWMQGARHVTFLINEHYTEEMSNILREPLLVDAVQKDLASLPSEIRSNAKVKALSSAFPKALAIVDVERDESISKADVQRLQSIADGAIKSLITN